MRAGGHDSCRAVWARRQLGRSAGSPAKERSVDFNRGVPNADDMLGLGSHPVARVIDLIPEGVVPHDRIRGGRDLLVCLDEVPLEEFDLVPKVVAYGQSLQFGRKLPTTAKVIGDRSVDLDRLLDRLVEQN